MCSDAVREDTDEAGLRWSRLAALLWMLSFLPLAATAAAQPGAADKGAGRAASAADP